jgi:hypothetical protein
MAVENKIIQQEPPMTVENKFIQSQEPKNFAEKVDIALNDRSCTSIELGNIGENLVVEAFETLNKEFNMSLEIQRISVEEKHSGDILVWDKESKILFVVEVKNKQVIQREDLKKFDYDVARLEKIHADFKVSGLFISLYNKLIDNNIKSFMTDFDKTYITRDYFTIEFLKLYVESIKKYHAIKTDIAISDADKQIIKTLQDTFDDFKFISDQCVEMQRQLEILQNNVQTIQNRFNAKISNCQEVLSKYNPESQKVSIVQRNLVKYCRERNWNPNKILIKEIKEIMGTTDLFETKTRLTKDKIISLARQYEKQYGY